MNLGDVVYLNSGSRPMTVVQIDADVATCSWDGGSQRYPIAALTAIDPLPALQHAREKALAQKAVDDPLPIPVVAKEAVPA